MRYTDRILNRIARFYPKKFTVYACQEPDGTHRACLLAEFKDREAAIFPLALEDAHEIAKDLMSTVMVLKPEICFGPDIAARFKSGDLTLEQLKKLV